MAKTTCQLPSHWNPFESFITFSRIIYYYTITISKKGCVLHLFFAQVKGSNEYKKKESSNLVQVQKQGRIISYVRITHVVKVFKSTQHEM